MVIVFLTHLFPDSSDNGVLLIGLELIIVVTFVTNIYLERDKKVILQYCLIVYLLNCLSKYSL